MRPRLTFFSFKPIGNIPKVNAPNPTPLSQVKLPTPKPISIQNRIPIRQKMTHSLLLYDYGNMLINISIFIILMIIIILVLSYRYRNRSSLKKNKEKLYDTLETIALVSEKEIVKENDSPVSD